MRDKFIVLFFPLFILVACAISGNINVSQSMGAQAESKNQIHIEQAVFNSFNFKTNLDTKPILDTLVNYIKHTSKGADIYINCARLNYIPILQAIEEAFYRGVNFHILVDYNAPSNKDGNQKAFIQLYPIFNNSQSEFILYTTDASDQGTNGTPKNHQKYALFSKVEFSEGFAKNIVLVTSRNFMHTGSKAQDAVIMSNKGLYKAFLKNWEVMANPYLSGINYTYTEHTVGDSIEVMFFPRIFNNHWDGVDPIIGILNKLSEYTSDTIAIAMAGWTIGRLNIVRKLKKLVNKGVAVEVVTRDKNTSIMEELKNLEEAGATLRILPTKTKNFHSKIMLIKGVWEGEKAKVLLCGSQNFTGSALRLNNEDYLMLKNSILFDNYWNYFLMLKNG